MIHYEFKKSRQIAGSVDVILTELTMAVCDIRDLLVKELGAEYTDELLQGIFDISKMSEEEVQKESEKAKSRLEKALKDFFGRGRSF